MDEQPVTDRDRVDELDGDVLRAPLVVTAPCIGAMDCQDGEGNRDVATCDAAFGDLAVVGVHSMLDSATACSSSVKA